MTQLMCVLGKQALQTPHVKHANACIPQLKHKAPSGTARCRDHNRPDQKDTTCKANTRGRGEEHACRDEDNTGLNGL